LRDWFREERVTHVGGGQCRQTSARPKKLPSPALR
jgi:hypothetical protein